MGTKRERVHVQRKARRRSIDEGIPYHKALREEWERLRNDARGVEASVRRWGEGPYR